MSTQDTGERERLTENEFKVALVALLFKGNGQNFSVYDMRIVDAALSAGLPKDVWDLVQLYSHSQAKALLERIDREVIGNPRPEDSTIFSSRRLRTMNGFDATNELITNQRTALRTIEEEIKAPADVDQ
jgi:hypothetical protein